ncbi:uncharacterized protein LOC135488248 isoform X2 [Lineus longissimus]
MRPDMSVIVQSGGIIAMVFVAQFVKGFNAYARDTIPYPHLNHFKRNGLFPLIQTYTDRIINELVKDKTIAITDARAKMIRDRLRGLYKHLKEHPALMERRLYVGSRAPGVYMDKKQSMGSLDVDSTGEESIKTSKKSIEYGIPHTICPSKTEWRRLFAAKDINDTNVEVWQPRRGTDGQQWFYTVECNEERLQRQVCPGCCSGIDHGL